MKQYLKQNGKQIALALVFVILAFMYGFAAVGCNTFDGVGSVMIGAGKDIQQASEGIKKSMSEN